MKSKQKRYIRKHIGKESVEEIALKLEIDIGDVKEYVSKCCSSRLDNNTKIDSSKPLKWHKVLLGIFNFVVFPFIIFLLAFNMNSFGGLIDTVESGQYLSCLNGIFQGKLPFKDFIPLAAGPLFIRILSAIFLF